MEVTVGWLPFEREALDKATTVRFAGVEIPVATPEDLVIYKALAWRDQDRSDMERLLVLYGRQIDLTRVRSFVEQFAEVLQEPERIPEFEALVGRALGPEARP